MLARTRRPSTRTHFPRLEPPTAPPLPSPPHLEDVLQPLQSDGDDARVGAGEQVAQRLDGALAHKVLDLLVGAAAAGGGGAGRHRGAGGGWEVGGGRQVGLWQAAQQPRRHYQDASRSTRGAAQQAGGQACRWDGQARRRGAGAPGGVGDGPGRLLLDVKLSGGQQVDEGGDDARINHGLQTGGGWRDAVLRLGHALTSRRGGTRVGRCWLREGGARRRMRGAAHTRPVPHLDLLLGAGGDVGDGPARLLLDRLLVAACTGAAEAGKRVQQVSS